MVILRQLHGQVGCVGCRPTNPLGSLTMTKHALRSPVLGMTTAVLALAFPLAARAGGPAEPFKVANIHFETNASACDMGIQILFDTDGITDGSVKAPKGKTIYEFSSKGAMKKTGGQTEGFLEGIEPQITELMDALGCAPSDEEGEVSLDDLFNSFPAGDYKFKGKTKGAKFED